MSVFFINSYQTGERDQWKEKYVKGVGLNLISVEGSEILIKLLEVDLERYDRRGKFWSYIQI